MGKTGTDEVHILNQNIRQKLHGRQEDVSNLRFSNRRFFMLVLKYNSKR